MEHIKKQFLDKFSYEFDNGTCRDWKDALPFGVSEWVAEKVKNEVKDYLLFAIKEVKNNKGNYPFGDYSLEWREGYNEGLADAENSINSILEKL